MRKVIPLAILTIIMALGATMPTRAESPYNATIFVEVLHEVGEVVPILATGEGDCVPLSVETNTTVVDDENYDVFVYVVFTYAIDCERNGYQWMANIDYESDGEGDYLFILYAITDDMLLPWDGWYLGQVNVTVAEKVSRTYLPILN